MASPQLENGFTRIANEILEKIYGEAFTSSELRIVLTVIRFTYGFNRKSHALSESFISKATGISIRHVKRDLAALISANVLLSVKEPTSSTSREIQFNKNYSDWRLCHRVTAVSSGATEVPSTGDSRVTQERKIKENINTYMCKSDLNEPFNRFWEA